MTDSEFDFNEFSLNEVIDQITKTEARIKEAEEKKEDPTIFISKLEKLRKILAKLKK
jgi:hypothetical protein